MARGTHLVFHKTNILFGDQSGGFSRKNFLRVGSSGGLRQDSLRVGRESLFSTVTLLTQKCDRHWCRTASLNIIMRSFWLHLIASFWYLQMSACRTVKICLKNQQRPLRTFNIKIHTILVTLPKKLWRFVFRLCCVLSVWLIPWWSKDDLHIGPCHCWSSWMSTCVASSGNNFLMGLLPVS